MPICSECGFKVDNDAKFCKNCGSELNVKSIINNNTKELEIKFGYSTSPNYSRAIKIAEKFENYSASGDDKNIIHTVSIPLNKVEDIYSLMDLISNWKSSRFFLDESEVTKSDINQPLNCYRSRQRAYDNKEYCHGESEWELNFWGCKRLNMPINSNEARNGWLSYGAFDKNNVWHFNKERIEHVLKRNLNDFEICPAINKAEIFNKLKKFPKTVDPKNNLDWNYLTEYKEIHGNFKEVATGVYPDIDFNNYAYFDNNDRNNLSSEYIEENNKSYSDKDLDFEAMDVELGNNSLNKNLNNTQGIDWKKFLLVLSALFIPIIGPILVLRSRRFGKFGKILAGIMLAISFISIIAN